MNVVLGASGHIGSALVKLLLEQGEKVVAITHDEAKAEALRPRAEAFAVDVHDTAKLRDVFRRGKRLFLLNPPAAPSTDTDVEERKTLRSILGALEGSGLDKIVAESTYGAREGEHIGDLGVLHEMETALAKIVIPTTILRGAYYFSNWDHALESAKSERKVHTFFPIDFVLPMVAPKDIAREAARLMLVPKGGDLHFVEGPARYSAKDVAAAFSAALAEHVVAIETPREERIPALKKMGFSDAAAASFSAMTDVALAIEPRTEVTRGQVTLRQYVDELVASEVNRAGRDVSCER